MFLSESFAIKDASYYNANSVSSDTTRTGLTTIPSNFKATYKLNRTTGKIGWVEIGQDSSNAIFFGVDSGNGAIGIYVRVNGSYETYQRNGGNIVSANSDVLFEYTNNNGVQSLKVGSTTINLTNSTITGRSYLKYNTDSGVSTIKELLIEPL